MREKSGSHPAVEADLGGVSSRGGGEVGVGSQEEVAVNQESDTIGSGIDNGGDGGVIA